MLNLFRPSLALLATLSCSAPLSALSLDEMKGEWKVDGDATWKIMTEDPRFAELPAQQKDGMQESFKTMSGDIRFTFADDGLTVVGIAGGDKAPASSFASTGEKTGTLTPEKKGEPVAFELKADGKLFVIASPGSPAIVLVLVPPDAEAKPEAKPEPKPEPEPAK